ncbi:GNAT family N-acetyltransferase [Flavobacterium sp. H122]|uniref:GNAT family N-acetyltransferase n=1 Tax=Flavobacterium sp. H122 TaxID=2529860 RepID=UPI0010A9A24F|nr:GNAT family N-acetyltransferase [Flavobacterium sp. H122]
MTYKFRKAFDFEAPLIWEIIQQAIARRKKDGSNQWQNGYPNLGTIENDIAKGNSYVLTDQDKVIAYSAVLFNDEPAYLAIDGKWLTEGDFLVVHRVAIDEAYLGQGLVQKMFGLFEDLALENGIHSIKVDTNFDNPAMLRIMDKLGYVYCGEVSFDGSPRKAFEKVLESK